MQDENNLLPRNNSSHEGQPHHSAQFPSTVRGEEERVINPLPSDLTTNGTAPQEAVSPTDITPSASANDTAPTTQPLNTDPPTPPHLEDPQQQDQHPSINPPQETHPPHAYAPVVTASSPPGYIPPTPSI